MDPQRFWSAFGPTTVERGDPMFHLSPTCCWWSGQSWPYATAQTLAAMANLLANDEQKVVTKADYYKLLSTYSKTHRKEGRPYLAEAANPDTGSFKGHDSYNHSEHYFHSSFCDLVITGLVGLKPREDETIEVNPLAPEDWAYFALDNVRYHGHLLTIIWDKSGSGMGREGVSGVCGWSCGSVGGFGFAGETDGTVTGSRWGEPPHPNPLPRSTGGEGISEGPKRINYAVNNEGARFLARSHHLQVKARR